MANQVMSRRLVAPEAKDFIRNESVDRGELELEPTSAAVDKTLASVSWDFSTTPILQPHPTNSHRARPSLGAWPSAPRPKLVIGEADDPLEHEADRVADLVLRMSVPEVPLATAPSNRNITVIDDRKPKARFCRKCQRGHQEHLPWKRQ
jgi:hypothetical protein